MEDRCVCCGAIIPEGRQVCLNCEMGVNEKTKLIDANKVFERANEVTFMGFRAEERKKHFMDLVSEILKQPTVDAVEVVRCKDCKHYVQFLRDEKECRCTIFSGCYDRPYPTEPDDFCSYGERREGE